MRTSFRPNSGQRAQNEEARMSDRNNLPEPIRHLPVRPDLDQLKHQAKDFLRNIHRGDAQALEEFNRFHPRADADPAKIKLSEAQFALARSYGAVSWPRLVQSCNLIDADRKSTRLNSSHSQISYAV